MFKILFLASIFVITAFVMFPENSVFAQCVENTDWPDAPCMDLVVNGSYPQDLVDRWAAYYDYKGAQFMESKKVEMDKAVKDDKLLEWVEKSLQNTNVWYYYHFSGKAPNPYPQKVGFEPIPSKAEYYVKYDYTDKVVALPAFIKKIPLPYDIRQAMLDWCADPNSSKDNKRFWDTIPIKILSTTAKFQSLRGNLDSFVIHSYGAHDTCPPTAWMDGTFTSENGDVHKFALLHDDNFFRYQIDEIQCKQAKFS